MRTRKVRRTGYEEVRTEMPRARLWRETRAQASCVLPRLPHALVHDLPLSQPLLVGPNSAAGIVRRQHGQDQKKAKDVSGKFLQKEKLGSLQEHRVSSRGHGFIQGVASWHVPERRSQERGT